MLWFGNIHKPRLTFIGHFRPIFYSFWPVPSPIFQDSFSNLPTHSKVGRHLWLFLIWKILDFFYINGLAKSLSNFYWFSTEMNNFSDVNNEKRTISEEFRNGQTPENLEKDTLDIYEELEALPEAVWGVEYHKNWSKSRQISFTWLGNRVYCSMCVMCVLSSPKPLPSWGSLLHGFPDRNQNKDSTFKNIQYPFLTHILG